MRGSPVLRFFLLAIALAVTAVGLQRITSARLVDERPPETPGELRPSTPGRVPFRLMLSAPAAAVELDAGEAIHPELSGMPLSGTLEMDLENPHIALVVRWQKPSVDGEHRFAKLTLEPPGQETWTHVFDSDGDIDDFLELPFPVTK